VEFGVEGIINDINEGTVVPAGNNGRFSPISLVEVDSIGQLPNIEITGKWTLIDGSPGSEDSSV